MISLTLLLAGQLTLAGPAWSPPPQPDDQRPASLPAVTLSEAVARARTESPRRRAAARIADSADAASRLAGQRPNPLVEFRTENWSRSSAPPPLDVFAVLTQPFEPGGRRAARRQIAEAESLAATAALGSLERELALETVRAYARGLRARALSSTLATYHDELTALVTSVARRVEEGHTAEADLLKLKTEGARVDSDLARVTLELDRSLAALYLLTGARVHASQLVEPLAVALPSGDAAEIAAGIHRRPEVVAALAGVERARQVHAFERSLRLPEVLVSGGYKRTAGSNTAVIGVSAAVPLFDRNGAAIARAIGAEQAATADHATLIARLESEAASTLAAARVIAERASASPRELLEPADAVRRAARSAYNEGAGDIFRLIDAERVWLDAYRAAIDLRIDALVATVEARFGQGEETIP